VIERTFEAWALVLLLGGCGSDPCDAGALRDELADARAGDTVRIGSCRIEGSFEVPAGVLLRGAGHGTVLASSGQTAVLTAAAGDGTTAIRDLSVESDGTIGILVRGVAGVDLSGLAVTATRGIGIGIEDTPTVSLENVSLVGPVTADNARDVPIGPTPDETATHGLVLLGVADAQLSDVRASGFASFGVLAHDCDVTWQGGGAPGSLGVGLAIAGGTATLTDLDLSGNLRGGELESPLAALFLEGASIDSTGLTVRGGEGIGLMHVGAQAVHRDLTVEDNTDAGVWVQDATSFELSGAATHVSGNRFAGLAVVDSSNVSIRDARIESTATALHVVEDTGTVEVGDGIQLVRSTQAIDLRDLALSANERVGLLVDLGGGSDADVAITSVQVDGTSYGAIVQNGTRRDDWDAGIDRQGDTATNDATLLQSGDRLDITDLVGPNCLPELPDLAGSGLDAIVPGL
jgi:hypothetical protein